MPVVTFVSSDGERTTLDAREGESLMQVAIMNNVGGIVGECGGSATCATCHVYVEEGFIEGLPARTEAEEEMLEFAASPRQTNSRLSCQIVVSADTDGIVVAMPPTQY